MLHWKLSFLRTKVLVVVYVLSLYTDALLILREVPWLLLVSLLKSFVLGLCRFLLGLIWLIKPPQHFGG